MQQNETVKKEPVVHTMVGEHIGYELGAKMIKDYFDKYSEGGAHFIGRKIIEDVLNQTDCIGVKIFRGLNEEGKLAYVIAGVNQDNEIILETAVVTTNGEIKKEEGIVADRARLTGWWDFNAL